MERFLRERLFEPAGMTSAVPKFDDAGTFVGSSYVYATARDFARFGELYRNDGLAADGTRVLQSGWTDHARTWAARDGENGCDYGRHSGDPTELGHLILTSSSTSPVLEVDAT